MKKIILTSWFLLAIILICGVNATAQLTIVSGVQGGSYHRFATDIKGITDSITVDVATSKGSLENFF